MARLLRPLPLVLAALLAVLAWEALPWLRAAWFAPQAEPRLVAPRGELAEAERSTIALFEAARGSVVFITTAERQLDPWTRNAVQVPRGSGSGFVWDALGHIVTNHHVIEGASSATVRLADGRSFAAQLVGTSPENDLAVLRIGVATGRPEPLPIGRSAELRVGQSVFAIGNPFGLDWTLTTGIVSALERSLPMEDGAPIRGLIQTDAAINPGNSGGPLLDSAGRLIGVNTAIYSPSGASAGIGFAVPVDTVNRVVPRLVAVGRYAPRDPGIRSDARLNAAIQRQLGVPGVFVLEVEAGSAAARAGLRPARFGRDGSVAVGDAVLQVNGRSVRDPAELAEAVERAPAGEALRLEIWRDGQRLRVSLGG